MANSKENETRGLTVKLISFGYKNGPPPQANLVLDVRFLKNPYWEEHLRPLTGLDQPVREYVVTQKLAREALGNLEKLLAGVLPAMLNVKADTFVVALGCTGGQHRSTATVQELADNLSATYPDYPIEKEHPGLANLEISEPFTS